jgi:hypothetical protein
MEQRMLVRETEQGAYLGPGPELEAAALPVAATPHFDVFDWGCRRLILGKCSRLPDDEDQVTRRYGIDFHRALPPFKGSSGFWCDWGTGPIEVNAYTYALHLPRTLQFREFTANLAFAASTEEAYQAKCQVYQDFYSYLFNSDARIILASPHSGEVRRPPDRYHPFPQSEIDGWTAGVMARCQDPAHQGKKRVLISLHSTDYFGALMDIGDFGLLQNRPLAKIVKQLQEDFSASLSPLLPGYRDYIIPYTRSRLEWFAENWGTLDPKRLTGKSTAARFEVVSLLKITGQPEPWDCIGLSEMDQALHNYWDRPPLQFIALNKIFSGRKTAQLLNLSAKLEQAGIDYAVQVECSRFLARYYPDLAARLIHALIDGLEALP